MPVPGRALTLQDLFAQLANNAGETIALDSSEVLNQLMNDNETLLLNVSGSTPTLATRTYYDILVNGQYPTTYWRLADQAASGTAADSNQNILPLYPRVNSTSMSGVTQGVASFVASGLATSFTNASSSNIVFPNGSSLQNVGDMTVEFWINFTSFQTVGGTYSLITKNVTAGGGVGEFEVYMFNNSGSGSIAWNQNNGYVASAVGSLSLSTWYYIAIARDSTAKTVKFYVNGVQVGATQSYTTPPSTTTGTVVIGASGSFQTAGYSMTELALYSKVLSGAQIATHYAWGTAADTTMARYGGPSSQYGIVPYPAYISPTVSGYSGSTALWGTFQWK